MWYMIYPSSRGHKQYHVSRYILRSDSYLFLTVSNVYNSFDETIKNKKKEGEDRRRGTLREKVWEREAPQPPGAKEPSTMESPNSTICGRTISSNLISFRCQCQCHRHLHCSRGQNKNEWSHLTSSHVVRLIYNERFGSYCTVESLAREASNHDMGLVFFHFFTWQFNLQQAELTNDLKYFSSFWIKNSSSIRYRTQDICILILSF